MENNLSYKVGVRCFTYNQAQYITDTLNGFVMQQTSFPFITMVVDDASTDGEQEVIASYVEENFDTKNQDIAYQEEADYAHITFAQHKTNKNCYIVVLYLKENHYQKGKNRKKLEYLAQWHDNVKYTALCEGDDYWIDPHKLQKQFDFLEANPDYSMVCTCAQQYIQAEEKLGSIIGYSEAFDLQHLLYGNPICTLTTMMRYDALNNYVKDIQPHTHNWRMGDLPIWLYFAATGKIGFIPDITSIYRVLTESASHSSDYNTTIAFFRSSIDVNLYFTKRYAPELSDIVEKGALQVELFLSYDYRNSAAVIACYKKIVDKGYTYTPRITRWIRRRVIKSRLRLIWERIRGVKRA